MLKIIDNFPASHDVDFILENGIELYKIDWNGEMYLRGFDPRTGLNINRDFRPIYDGINDDGDFDIIGFEEV